MLERLDELARKGYDVKITRLVIHERWRVDIILGGSHPDKWDLCADAEHEELGKAIEMGLAEIDAAHERYRNEKERQKMLAEKARRGVKPRFKLV